MKLFNFAAICSALPSQNSTNNRIDYNGYKVLTANWTEVSLSSEVEKILVSKAADIWSNPEDIFENKSVEVMVSAELATEFKLLLRYGYLGYQIIFVISVTISLISEIGVTLDEKIADVGELIEEQKRLKKSKMAESPTTFAYDVYYDYDEVSPSPNLVSVNMTTLFGQLIN